MITSEQVKQFADERIKTILSSTNPSYQKAALAKLRRGVGREPGDLPELWGELLLGMPDEMQGRTEPSRAEQAIYSALTLFSLHQQGHEPKTEVMYLPGQRLGIAAAKLVEEESDRENAMERIRRRFNQAATAENVPALTYHLRGLVQLMRAKGIPMDYAQLAAELFLYQNPEARGKVRLQWGRDFYSQYNHMERDMLGKDKEYE